MAPSVENEPRGSASPEASVAIAGGAEMACRRAAAVLGQDGLDVVQEAGGGYGLAELAERSELDVVVVVCASLQELATAKQLRQAALHARLVVVAPLEARNEVRKLLEAGVHAIVRDSEMGTVLPVAVRAVLAGQLSVPSSLRDQLERPALSYRERQILGMVVMGFTNAEIAAKLFLAESTVKSHLSSCFSKLGVRSRNEAAALILDPSQSLGPGILSISPDELPGAAVEVLG